MKPYSETEKGFARSAAILKITKQEDKSESEIRHEIFDAGVKFAENYFIESARAFTDKMKEARDFVIKFTKEHDHPPSYQILANALRIKRTAAYNRMKYCRELMACRH